MVPLSSAVISPSSADQSRPAALPGPGRFPSFRSDLPLALVCTIAFAIWHTIGSHHFSPRYLVAAGAVALTATLAGHVLERLLRFQYGWDFPVRFLAGYLAVNTALYVLVWPLPFGIVADFAILAAVTLAAYLFLRGRPTLPSPPTPSRLPAALCVVLSLLAPSLWAQDSISPLIRRGDAVVVKSWGDTPIHVVQVAIFAASHGRHTIHEPRMAGAPEHFGYHYASYLMPALLTTAGRTPAYDAFACYWVPVGMFLIGLGAYALVRWWWGPWPALAATALLQLAPDAAYQGFGNYFLSYHWLVQVTAATGYGIAAAALAWVLMFEACRARRFGLVILSFLTLATGLLFKAHLVLPSALPLYAFPALAMAGIPRRWRVTWFTAAIVSFVLVVYVSQFSHYVPVLRPDFSAAKDYLASIVRYFEHDTAIKQTFAAHFTANSSLANDLAWGTALLLLGTFGVAAVAYPFLALSLHRTMTRSALFFPLLFLAVYLFMSLALAYDDRDIGRPEELLHRPFPWAYFVLYAWLGGAIYRALWGDAAPTQRPTRLALSLLLLTSLTIPAICGHDVQAGPTSTWGMAVINQSHPAGLIDCAEYVRRQSHGTRPIIQDSGDDPELIVAAFSDAQPYAANCRTNIRPTPGLVERLADVQRLPTFRDARDVRKYAADHGITWYLLRPETKVAWPAPFLNRPAFQSHGYRVYRFEQPK